MVQDSLIRIGMNDNGLHFEEKCQSFHEIKICIVTVLVVISLDGSRASCSGEQYGTWVLL